MYAYKCVQNYRPCYYIILPGVESINIYLDKLHIGIYIYIYIYISLVYNQCIIKINNNMIINNRKHIIY